MIRVRPVCPGALRPEVAGARRAEYDPPNTRTSWEDGRWVG
jgi:hypothetical protein